jgi:hypothetical protein
MYTSAFSLSRYRNKQAEKYSMRLCYVPATARSAQGALYMEDQLGVELGALSNDKSKRFKGLTNSRKMWSIVSYISAITLVQKV